MMVTQDSIQDAAGEGVPSRAGKSAIGDLSFGMPGEHLWNKPRVGVRKPLSLDRKAKARKATKAAAKSRRRNRQ